MQNSQCRIQNEEHGSTRCGADSPFRIPHSAFPIPHSAFRIPHSAFLLLALAAAAITAGCAGYQLGNRSLYRPDIRTVYVPVAQSDSFRLYLGERLTEAVVKQIELRTPYKVVDEAAADSVLNLRLISESKRLLTNNRFSEPRDIETDFFIQVSWVDRRGDLIMTPAGIPAAPLLLNISQQANFVPEGGQSLATAQQEAIARLAEQIVGQMELAW
jgi:outer membrane lipopolysaccharide assembly protein LptE/RlpB